MICLKDSQKSIIRRIRKKWKLNRDLKPFDLCDTDDLKLKAEGKEWEDYHANMCPNCDFLTLKYIPSPQAQRGTSQSSEGVT